MLSFELDDPGSYGRVLRNGNGGLEAIVEAADATSAQLGVREVNSSIYVFRADRLWPVLDRLEPHNAQGELYLTDSVALLVADGGTVTVHVAPDPEEAIGVNTRSELAEAAARLRDRVNGEHMAGRRHDRRSADHLDRRRGRDRARRRDPPVHGHPRRQQDRRGIGDRPARGGPRRHRR